MTIPYFLLIFIYFILSLLNVTGSGPHYARLREESKETDEWVNQQREGRDRDKPRYVSIDYRYYTLLTFALIPFHTLTKDNKFYIVRLFGYLTDVVYGGIGLIIWLMIYFIKIFLFALCGIFFKLKNL